jgi:hypothetical protein
MPTANKAPRKIARITLFLPDALRFVGSAATGCHRRFGLDSQPVRNIPARLGINLAEARVTVIGGKRHADDYEVIWRGLTIGRIMKRSGVPSTCAGPCHSNRGAKVNPVLTKASLSRIGQRGRVCWLAGQP